mgnify:CR=1 FL=1
MIRVKGFVCAVVLCVAVAAIAGEGWELRKNSNGIRCYTRPVKGSSLDQFRGESVVNARFELVAEVIRDAANYTNWMHECKEIKVLKDLGKNDQMIVYYVNDSQWPVADRDVVVRTRSRGNPKTGEYTIIIESFDYQAMPAREGRVRMPRMRAVFVARYIDENSTGVGFNILADPGGTVPAPLVNAFTKDHPYKTILGLRRMVKLDKYRQRVEGSRYRQFVEEVLALRGN